MKELLQKAIDSDGDATDALLVFVNTLEVERKFDEAIKMCARHCALVLLLIASSSVLHHRASLTLACAECRLQANASRFSREELTIAIGKVHLHAKNYGEATACFEEVAR